MRTHRYFAPVRKSTDDGHEFVLHSELCCLREGAEGLQKKINDRSRCDHFDLSNRAVRIGIFELREVQI